MFIIIQKVLKIALAWPNASNELSLIQNQIQVEHDFSFLCISIIYGMKRFIRYVLIWCYYFLLF